jgi:Transcription initiation factor IID, 18kD subunit
MQTTEENRDSSAHRYPIHPSHDSLANGGRSWHFQRQETVRTRLPFPCSLPFLSSIHYQHVNYIPTCRKILQSNQGAAAKRPAPARSSRAPTRRNSRRDEENVPEVPKTCFKGIFARDLGDIMYGFGDSTDHPVPETLDAVEAIAVDFVRELITRCLQNVRSFNLCSSFTSACVLACFRVPSHGLCCLSMCFSLAL